MTTEYSLNYIVFVPGISPNVERLQPIPTQPPPISSVDKFLGPKSEEGVPLTVECLILPFGIGVLALMIMSRGGARNGKSRLLDGRNHTISSEEDGLV